LLNTARMRFSVVLVLAAACGTEPTRSGPAPDASMGTTDGDGTMNTGGGSDGGGGGSDGGTALTICEQAAQHSDLTFIQDNVFTSTCALAHCHDENSQSAGLVLAKGMARDSLVNRASTVQSGWMRVVPGDPAHSYLAVAIGGEPGTPPEGSYMPWGGAPMLCSQELDAINRWIAAGANP